MRYQPTLFRSRDYQALPTGDLTGPDRGEAGSDSESWFHDLIGGGPDVNPELNGPAKFAVYDEMAKTDAGVKSLLMFLSLHVRSANWGLNARSDDPVDVFIRDYVDTNLGVEDELGWLDVSWDKQLQQPLVMGLRDGVCLEEKIWGDVRSWFDADGDEHLVRPLVRLAPRPAKTVEKLDRAADGSILWLHQTIAGTRPIRGSKLSYIVFEPEPGSWDGVSILRPAWGAWKIKKTLMIGYGIGYDRFAMGLPKVWHPDTPDGQLVAKAIGRNVRSHERGYVHFPVPEGGTKQDSEWDLEILNAAQTLADPTPMIRICCEQIAEAGLQQFTQLGMTNTGSRAVGEVQADAFYLAVNALANDLRRERLRQVIRPLVEVNFGADAAERRCPILTVSKVQVRNVEVISKAIELLSAAGFKFTDAGAEDDVRDLLGMPKLNRDALAAHGITLAQLENVLGGLGLDQATFASIIDALPAEIGVARNRVQLEGAGLGLTG